MFKATVHQVLGILVVMESVYGWVKLFILESGRVPAAYDSQFEACVTNHLRDYRLRCERLVYGICMCRIVGSGFIWLNGYGLYFTDVPAHLSH